MTIYTKLRIILGNKQHVLVSKMLIFLLYLTISCDGISENKKLINQIELNKADAIQIHDELMLEMNQLELLKTILQKNASDSTLDSQHENIKFAIIEIDKVNKLMWDWMHNFNVKYTAENDSVTLKHYEAQLDSIKHIKVLFDSAIANGNKISGSSSESNNTFSDFRRLIKYTIKSLIRRIS